MKKGGNEAEKSTYTRRLRSAQKNQVCTCKVGACSICGSKCRRCMCACDGVELLDALKRSRGGYRRTVNMIAKERGLVKSRPTRNAKSKKQEMSSSQHTASKKKPPTPKAKKKPPTTAKKSTSAKHRFQKVGKVRSKRASNVSTSRKKNTQHHSDSSFQLNPNDDDTISVNSNSTINASIVNAPAIPEFDLQIEDIEVEKDCDDAPYNVIHEVAPAIEQECTAPH